LPTYTYRCEGKNLGYAYGTRINCHWPLVEEEYGNLGHKMATHCQLDGNSMGTLGTYWNSSLLNATFYFGGTKLHWVMGQSKLDHSKNENNMNLGGTPM